VTTVVTRGADETVALGRRLAALLAAGDLLVLTGPLGAGKTALARGLGEGLGVRGPVTSPTFVLAREHRPDPARGGRLPLVHVDLYRLRDRDGNPPGLDALEDLDLTAALEGAVVLVEWGEGLGETLGADHIEVRIDRHGAAGGDEGDAERTVRLVGHGTRWQGVDLGAGLEVPGHPQR
jgi:tRNA threonylcarbamoyladenosine biosynthesis protein TsaE